MADLYVTEYHSMAALHGNQRLAVPEEPAIAEQKVEFTTATQSNAFNDKTTFVRLVAGADCHVKFGSNPTATANHQRLLSGEEYFRAVQPGDKLSVYDGSS